MPKQNKEEIADQKHCNKIFHDLVNRIIDKDPSAIIELHFANTDKILEDDNNNTGLQAIPISK